MEEGREGVKLLSTQEHRLPATTRSRGGAWSSFSSQPQKKPNHPHLDLGFLASRTLR
jgi:hypothetical protein